MAEPERRPIDAVEVTGALIRRLDDQSATDDHDDVVGLTASQVVAIASRSLLGSLDVLMNVAELARLVLPLLGSWSIVSVIGEDGTPRDVGSWHVDPELREDVEAYSRLRLSAFEAESFVGRAAATGEAIVISPDATELIRSRMLPGPARDMIGRLHPEFVAVLPMIARDRTVGLLSVYSDAPWTPGRREVADDIVARAALVIDNSLAYQRERTARAKAEAAEQRLSLLAQVSESLADTDDPDRAVGTLANLVVPALADWAFVTVIGRDGSLRDIGLAHRDPERMPDLEAYSATHLEAMSDDAAVSRALRTGAPVIVSQLREDILTSFLPDPAVAELTRRLAPHGVASFPLNARGRTLGALTLATTAARGPHTADEVALGLEISRRAGPVLDAARAAHQAQTLAESLQRSMLETNPAPAALHVATRYRPASIDREIGGDWYDVVALPDGTTLVSIGDAMGHDVAAIAAMAQLRTLMRAVAWTDRRSPAQILSATDATNVGLGPRMFATAVVVHLGLEKPDGSVDVRWSSAGHLPPVVIGADGAVVVIEAPTKDIPLGVLATHARHDHELTLAPGSVLLLYTDGLIERRHHDLGSGLAALVAAVDDLKGYELEALLDALVVRLMGDPPHNDDAALLAVRASRVPEPANRPAAVSGTLALQPTERAAARAREFIASRCAHLPKATVDDLLVLVSELVTNALRYGRPPLSLDASIRPDVVRVSVNDNGPELLVRHDGAPNVNSTTGRGLLIVGALAHAWGVRHVDGSEAKSVWFELHV